MPNFVFFPTDKMKNHLLLFIVVVVFCDKVGNVAPLSTPGLHVSVAERALPKVTLLFWADLLIVVYYEFCHTLFVDYFEPIANTTMRSNSIEM